MILAEWSARFDSNLDGFGGQDVFDLQQALNHIS